MKFSIVIYAAPYSAESAATALRFAQSLIEQGHELYRLFFFGDGVHNASKLTVVAQDEINLQQQWSKLIEEHDIDSVICVSSALQAPMRAQRLPVLGSLSMLRGILIEW